MRPTPHQGAQRKQEGNSLGGKSFLPTPFNPVDKGFYPVSGMGATHGVKDQRHYRQSGDMLAQSFAHRGGHRTDQAVQTIDIEDAIDSLAGKIDMLGHIERNQQLWFAGEQIVGEREDFMATGLRQVSKSPREELDDVAGS